MPANTRDTASRFLLRAQAYRDTVSRTLLQSATQSRDARTRFRLRALQLRDTQARFVLLEASAHMLGAAYGASGAQAHLQLATSRTKTLSLWNSGTGANNPEPAGWAAVGFNDSAWSNAAYAPEATAPLGADTIWAEWPPTLDNVAGLTGIMGGPGSQPGALQPGAPPSGTAGERALFRHPFSLPPEVPSALQVDLYVQGNLNGLYVNGQRIDVYRADWGNRVRRIAIDIGLLLLGATNVLGMDVTSTGTGPYVAFVYEVGYP